VQKSYLNRRLGPVLSTGKKLTAMPVHLALERGSPGRLSLQCVPEKVSQVVEFMLRHGAATVNVRSVSCPRCRALMK